MRPLVIYLDNQDYVNMFYNYARDPVVAKVKDYLIEKVAAGKIIIPFSMFTVMEFITKAESDIHLSERRRRGELIYEMCGLTCFHPYYLLNDEGPRISHKGEWFTHAGGSFELGAERFEEVKVIACRYIEGASSNRGEKRRQMKYFFKSNGNFREDGLKSLGIFPSQSLGSGDKFGTLLFELLTGGISVEVFDRRLSLHLFDPRMFSTYAYQLANIEDLRRKLLGKYFDKISESFEKSVAIHEGIIAYNEKARDLRRRMRKDGLLEEAEIKRLVKVLDEPAFKPNANTIELANYFKDGRFGYVTTYFEAISRRGYKFTQSDVIDVLQLIHAKDADLFRVDKKMFGIFGSLPMFEGKLVRKFSDLPDLIEEKLMSEAY